MMFLAGWLRNGKETRRRIAELVAYFPGIHVSEISVRLGLAWSTVDYHVRQMERKSIIDLQKDSRELRAFPRGLPSHERAWLVALRDDDACRILRTLLERPDLGITSLSAGLDLSKKVIKHHLGIFVDTGLLRREGEFRPRFKPQPGTEGWLAERLAAEPGRAPELEHPRGGANI